MIELTVKVSTGHYPTDNCNGGCSFFRNAALGCMLRLAKMRTGLLAGLGKPINYWQPGPDCPGPGHFCLTPCEETPDE